MFGLALGRHSKAILQEHAAATGKSLDSPEPSTGSEPHFTEGGCLAAWKREEKI